MHSMNSKPNPLFLMNVIAVLAFLAVASVADAAQVAHEKTKEQIVTSVETHRDELIGLADQVWELAEIALREEKASGYSGVSQECPPLSLPSTGAASR